MDIAKKLSVFMESVKAQKSPDTIPLQFLLHSHGEAQKFLEMATK